jgi:hypothetical protein
MTFGKTADRQDIFNEDDINIFSKLEMREQPILGVPGASCKTNLFFGFFFDGTKNNYVLAEKGKNHSNVARLYDCFPGLSVRGVLPASAEWQYKPANFTHFFKVYIPGVASPFKEVNDSGTGLESTRGAAMGYRGEARIIWALIQAINNVHRYFYKAPLVDAAEAAELVSQIDLSPANCRAMDPSLSLLLNIPSSEEKTRKAFEMILNRLHKAVAQHWTDKQTGRPKKIDPGIVQTIYVSIFGFSRGATEARAFASWLFALCKLDGYLTGKPGATSLGGFDIKIDFMGLFDTVASIGAGNTLGNSIAGKRLDGHSSWAGSGMLQVPAGIRCLHLVAAHEVRRSFPLDSIAVGQTMADNCSEVVFPGVHSDIGGGYCPCEQGKGADPDGVDMLARIPLVYMYKYARMAGVPLKLEHASEKAQQRFRIDPKTIKALNDYLALAKCKVGPLHTIMREQANLHMQWRLSRRAPGNSPLELTGSFARASVFDQNDLHSSNLDFEKEVAMFESWLAQKGRAFTARAQAPGFGNEHESEWQEIATWWKKPPAPAAAVQRFFDEYIHDSRAWFKLIPGNPDSEEDMHALLKEWVALRQSGRQRNALAEKLFQENQKALFRLVGRKQDANSPKPPPKPDGLTDAQRRAADEYLRTGRIPSMLTEGREPFEWAGVGVKAGYLRYRKVYGGSDNVLISETPAAEPDRLQA